MKREIMLLFMPFILIFAVVIVMAFVKRNENRSYYAEGKAQMEQGNYDKALDNFVMCEQFKNSEDLMVECYKAQGYVVCPYCNEKLWKRTTSIHEFGKEKTPWK